MYRFTTLSSKSTKPLDLGRFAAPPSLHGLFIPWYGNPLVAKDIDIQLDKPTARDNVHWRVFGERVVFNDKQRFLVHQVGLYYKYMPGKILLNSVAESLLLCQMHGLTHALQCPKFSGRHPFKVRRHLARTNIHTYQSAQGKALDIWKMLLADKTFGEVKGIRYFTAKDDKSIEPQFLTLSPTIIKYVQSFDFASRYGS